MFKHRMLWRTGTSVLVCVFASRVVIFTPISAALKELVQRRVSVNERLLTALFLGSKSLYYSYYGLASSSQRIFVWDHIYE